MGSELANCGLQGESRWHLIGVMVCVHAALQVQLFINVGSGWLWCHGGQLSLQDAAVWSQVVPPACARPSVTFTVSFSCVSDARSGQFCFKTC